MKNKQNHKIYTYSFRLGLIIFSCYILASFISGFLLLILNLCGMNMERINIWLLIVLVLISSTILAFLLTFIRMRGQSKFISQLTSTLDKMASGDFSGKIDINIKDPMLMEIAENLNKVIAELNSNAILKNDFIKNFSHEFKTPITSIKGFSELLANNKKLTEKEKQKYYQIIKEESTRLANLSNMTMLLSKLKSQSLNLEKQEFYVDQQIEEVALLFFEEAKKKNIDIQIELDHIKILATKELVKELWINLLSNAIKYTNSGGKIIISSYETTTSYVFSFQDNGQGIDDNTKKHIFDEYYQGDTSRVNGGIGLGLSICKKICDLHHYQITLLSQINIGSTFSVIVPK